MINVARYYYYKTIKISSQKNDIGKNVHKKLCITRIINNNVNRLITTFNMLKLYYDT